MMALPHALPRSACDRAKDFAAFGYSADDAMSMAADISDTPEVSESGDLVVLLNGREVILLISVIRADSERE